MVNMNRNTIFIWFLLFFHFSCNMWLSFGIGHFYISWFVVCLSPVLIEIYLLITIKKRKKILITLVMLLNVLISFYSIFLVLNPEPDGQYAIAISLLIGAQLLASLIMLITDYFLQRI
jgi:hypothetical protein